jgi:hypothetical protein
MLINPIIRIKDHDFRHAYPPTRDNNNNKLKSSNIPDDGSVWLKHVTEFA